MSECPSFDDSLVPVLSISLPPPDADEEPPEGAGRLVRDSSFLQPPSANRRPTSIDVGTPTSDMSASGTGTHLLLAVPPSPHSGSSSVTARSPRTKDGRHLPYGVRTPTPSPSVLSVGDSFRDSGNPAGSLGPPHPISPGPSAAVIGQWSFNEVPAGFDEQDVEEGSTGGGRSGGGNGAGGGEWTTTPNPTYALRQRSGSDSGRGSGRISGGGSGGAPPLPAVTLPRPQMKRRMLQLDEPTAAAGNSNSGSGNPLPPPSLQQQQSGAAPPALQQSPPPPPTTTTMATIPATATTPTTSQPPQPQHPLHHPQQQQQSRVKGNRKGHTATAAPLAAGEAGVEDGNHAQRLPHIHTSLIGRCAFVPIPLDLPPYQPLPADGDASSSSLPPPLFLGQLRFETTAAEIRYLLQEMSGVEPVRIEPRGHGCIHLVLRSDADRQAVVGLRQRVLFDQSGVWFAESVTQSIQLQEYLRSRAAPRKTRLPKDTMVIEEPRVLLQPPPSSSLALSSTTASSSSSSPSMFLHTASSHHHHHHQHYHLHAHQQQQRHLYSASSIPQQPTDQPPPPPGHRHQYPHPHSHYRHGPSHHHPQHQQQEARHDFDDVMQHQQQAAYYYGGGNSFHPHADRHPTTTTSSSTSGAPPPPVLSSSALHYQNNNKYDSLPNHDPHVHSFYQQQPQHHSAFLDHHHHPHHQQQQQHYPNYVSHDPHSYTSYPQQQQHEGGTHQEFPHPHHQQQQQYHYQGTRSGHHHHHHHHHHHQSHRQQHRQHHHHHHHHHQNSYQGGGGMVGEGADTPPPPQQKGAGGGRATTRQPQPSSLYGDSAERPAGVVPPLAQYNTPSH